MIVKLRLSGEQYFELLKFLQSPANRYENQLQNVPEGTAFAKIMAVKAEGDQSQKYKALCEHDVTLEIKQEYMPVAGRGFTSEPVPLSVLAEMFAALGLYPMPAPREPQRGVGPA